MRLAKIVFTVAGVWGLIVLTPLYFTFDAIGAMYPPPIAHPDFYYGFVGVAMAWQIGFLVIGRDPARFRLMMIPAMLEKFIYVTTLSLLYAQRRLQFGQFVVALPDFVLGVLFVVAFFRVPGRGRAANSAEMS